MRLQLVRSFLSLHGLGKSPGLYTRLGSALGVGLVDLVALVVGANVIALSYDPKSWIQTGSKL